MRCKGWGDHRDSHAVSVHVTARENDRFSCSPPLLALLLKRRLELDVNSQKMPRVIHGIEIRMEYLVSFTSPMPGLIHGVDLRRT